MIFDRTENNPEGQSNSEQTLRTKQMLNKNSRTRETKNLLTDADSRTNTMLERMRDLSQFFYFLFFFERLRFWGEH